MGGIYPAAPSTAEIDLIKLRRFLNDPTGVNRRANELAANTFLSDFLFPEVISTNGSLLYEISDGVYLDREPEVVAPGAVYPRAKPTEGDLAFAAVPKTGIDVPITDEKLAESGRNEIDRALTQVGRHVRRVIDTRALTALGTAVTLTQAAVGGIAFSAAGARPWLTVELAKASIDDEPEDYEADTVVLTRTNYAYAMEALLPALPRESATGVLQTGQLPVINGMTWVPAALPAGISGLVLDRKVFGARAFRDLPSPEYTGSSATGIETWVRRNPLANDEYLARGRRIMLAVVREPRAARKLTGI